MRGECHKAACASKSLRRKTLAKKTRKPAHRAWSKEDVKTLKAMARSKAGVMKIAKALKRTRGATTVKAAKLGVSLSMS